MIQQETILQVVDNSGIKSVKCIKVFGSSKKRYGLMGDVIRASVQELRHSRSKRVEYKKGDLVLCLIVHLKSIVKRKTGQSFQFLKNCVIVIDKNKTPSGTRIFTPLFKEFRNKKYLKILSLTPTIL